MRMQRKCGSKILLPKTLLLPSQMTRHPSSTFKGPLLFPQTPYPRNGQPVRRPREMRCHKSGIFLAGSHRESQAEQSRAHALLYLRQTHSDRGREGERERESCKGFSGRISPKNAVIIHHSPPRSNSAQTDRPRPIHLGFSICPQTFCETPVLPM